MGKGWIRKLAAPMWNSRALAFKPLQGFFHWNFSGGLILSFYALAVAMISLATYFSNADYFFGWAYFFAVCGLIWRLGYWLTSETLEKKRKRTSRQMRGLDPYSGKPHTIMLLCGLLLILVVFFGVCILIHGTYVRKRLQSTSDYLIPGSDPTPPNVCGNIPSGALRILLGPMGASSTHFPTNVISVDGEPLLSMERTTDDRLAISTDIYDRNHDIVAEIKHNSYTVDSSAFRVSRESLSDLSVFVRHDKERVLNIQYLNPTTMYLTGIFRTKSAELRVNSDSVYLNGERIRIHNCVVDGANVFGFFTR
jgi:hypothetical protein